MHTNAQTTDMQPPKQIRLSSIHWEFVIDSFAYSRIGPLFPADELQHSCNDSRLCIERCVSNWKNQTVRSAKIIFIWISKRKFPFEKKLCIFMKYCPLNQKESSLFYVDKMTWCSWCSKIKATRSGELSGFSFFSGVKTCVRVCIFIQRWNGKYRRFDT